jgi:hypothetical protein
MTVNGQPNRRKTTSPSRGVFRRAARPAKDTRDVAKSCFRGPRFADRRFYVR